MRFAVRRHHPIGAVIYCWQRTAEAVFGTSRTIRSQRSSQAWKSTVLVERMKPDTTTLQIFNRYADGEIELSEINRLWDEYSHTIL
jgi:hypothetical protein